MRTSAFGLTAALALALFWGALSTTGEGSAQSYPPPVGSLSVEAPSTTPGGSSNVTATVLDNDGNPVEGAEVVFTIISQPGDDAHWADGGLQTTAITGADGVATAILVAGSSPGTIIIETTSGEKTAQVTLGVEEEAEGLPPTGGLPTRDEGSGGVAVWQIVFLATGAVALAAGLTAMIRRNNRT
jgi:hypothetical protein